MFNKYEVIPEGEDWDEYEPRTWEGFDHEHAAQEAAKWFWSECDGWEWMRDGAKFLVRMAGVPEDTITVAVTIDFEPVFYALEVFE